MVHIYERGGVMLHVVFSLGSDGVPLFHEARVMDASYHPIGPNLLPLLDGLHVLGDAEPEGVREAETVLSNITGEVCKS
jgi:hypothetical protein